MKPYRVVVQPEAQEEVNAIRVHQNGIDPKRGLRFIEAFEACLEQLQANPSFQKRRGIYRHVMLHRLPYRVIFEVEQDTVFVYQVRHTSRRPSKKFGP